MAHRLHHSRQGRREGGNRQPFDFPMPFAPFLHQSRAWRRLPSKKGDPHPIIVTTGTGSVIHAGLEAVDPDLAGLPREAVRRWVLGCLHRHRLRGALMRPYLVPLAKQRYWGKAPFGRSHPDRETYPPFGHYMPHLMVTGPDKAHDHVLVPTRGNLPPWHIVRARRALGLVNARKRLQDQQKALDAQEHDAARAIEQELRILKGRMHSLNRTTSLELLTDAGLLPNYAFPERGELILAEDGSLWAIQPIDRITCFLWMSLENLVITTTDLGAPGYSYLLVNTDTEEAVRARFLGFH